jgi:hypothetical protein
MVTGGNQDIVGTNSQGSMPDPPQQSKDHCNMIGVKDERRD